MAFSMNVADAEALKAEVIDAIKAEPEEVAKLREAAQNNVKEIVNLDLDSFEGKKMILQSIEAFGLESMQRSSNKNALLKTSVAQLSESGSEGGVVSKSLQDLHREIKDLDPSLVDFAKGGVLGKLFNPIRAYFQKYEKAEDVIGDIMASLAKGKERLKNDNTTLAMEEQSLRELSKRINKEIELGTMMDACIVAELEKAEASNADPEKIRFVQEEILFPLRQRVMDMQQMVVVNHQGIIAIELVCRNNKELMRGVDRAMNVTVSALRTAVMVASALYNQRIVLKKIQLLNETTNNLISSTSKMLREQGAEIQKSSMESTVSVDVLKESYKDLMAALDEISTFKQKALPVMQGTIATFREMAEQGEMQIRNMEKGNALNM